MDDLRRVRRWPSGDCLVMPGLSITRLTLRSFFPDTDHMATRKRVTTGRSTTANRKAAPANPKPPLDDWRGRVLEEVRGLILQADPAIVEERKWKKPSNPAGVPVWSRNGIICTGETYKGVVKLTFAQGAALDDKGGRALFNASLEGSTRRAIDIHEGEKLNGAAFKSLIRAAAAFNLEARGDRSPEAKASTRKADHSKAPVKLLSGGNPQIAKADGDGPVKAYIEAMPGWKSALGARIDAIIERTVPNVRKAVRWNSPFYGVEGGKSWFASFHVLTKYVKVTFFEGMSLRPIPPGGTPKSQQARWIDIYEDDDFDEEQFAEWVKQAAKLPGWTP